MLHALMHELLGLHGARSISLVAVFSAWSQISVLHYIAILVYYNKPLSVAVGRGNAISIMGGLGSQLRNVSQKKLTTLIGTDENSQSSHLHVSKQSICTFN